MSQYDKLLQQLEDFRKKITLKVEKLQAKCKHKNTERWSDYGGINEQCKDCGKYLR